MDIRDLQVFLSVAKHLNYTRAAEEVNLSQPSVSVRTRQLERDLGSSVYRKDKHLSRATRAFIETAQRALALAK